MVADTLSRKSFGILSVLRKLSKPLHEEFCKAEIEIINRRQRAMTL